MHPGFTRFSCRIGPETVGHTGTTCITRDKALPSRDPFQVREDRRLLHRIGAMCLLCIPWSDRSYGIHPGSCQYNSR